MSTPLSAAAIVDFVNGYANLSPATTINIHKSGGPFGTGQYKNIGPNYIDFGTNTNTQRYPLDGQFIRLNLEIATDTITLCLASDTTVV